MSRNDRFLGLSAAVLGLSLFGLTGGASPIEAPEPPVVAAPDSEEAARKVLACVVATGRIGFAERREAVFTVELALDEASQREGLMWRDHLEPQAGMLFVFTPPRPAQFWMKNTLIPLDMIFIDPLGRVRHVEREAVPGDLTSRGPAGVTTAAVLEIAGGRAAEVGLELGDLAVCPPPDV